ncbi:hypothetical protein ACOSQ3_018072 [Xanthoceras sorbifolium]
MKIRATQFSQSAAPPRIRSHQQLKTQAPMDRRRKKWKNGSAREKNQRPEAANPKSNQKDQKKNMDDSG